MRFCATLLFVILSKSLFSQQSEVAKFLSQKKVKIVLNTHDFELKRGSNVLNKQTDLCNKARLFLLENTPELQIEHTDLKVLNVYESMVGTHIQFIQTYKNAEVYQSNIKISLNKLGQVINIVNDLVDLRGVKFEKMVLEPKQELVFDGKELIVCNKRKDGIKEQLISVKNEVLYEKSNRLNKTDTQVMAKIFNPDPLTSARKLYGIPYVNYNKLDTPILNNERQELELTLKMDEEGYFIAENDFAVIKDEYTPVSAPFKTKNKEDLVVTRNTDIFKQEMALYHVEQYQKMIKKLGFDSLNRQIAIDALGDWGEASRLEFIDSLNCLMVLGIGGIPDAEDADVIIHEYTHAISFFIAPNTIEGEERVGIDEGNCDILAAIYSKKISDFEWRKIFNWDGNETWNGRNTLNTRKYDQNRGTTRYPLSLIWSAAITDIADTMGLDTTIQLLFTAMASLQNNMTIPQFAQIFLQADSLLYQKSHHPIIKKSFIDRMLITDVSTEEIINEKLLKIINSQGFAVNQESLRIEIPSNELFDICLIDLQGKKVLEFKNQQNLCSIHPEEVKKGLYVLKIKFGGKNFYYKIAKY